jgi:hypothetical protein
MNVRLLRKKLPDGASTSAGGTRARARSTAAVVVVCVGAALLAAACSSSSGSSPTTAPKASGSGNSAQSGSGSGSSTQGGAAQTVADVKTLQHSLSVVGCYSGTVDGVTGPQTTKAIRSFQAASHLAVDGIVGQTTQGALTSAVKAGRRVCAAQAPPTTAPPSTPKSAPATTPKTPAAPSTTAPAPSTVTAACTVAAISAALSPDEKVLSYQCGNGWAGGTWQNSQYAAAFLLQSQHGVWVKATSAACQNAAALGIPANVLNVSFCKVS